MKEEKSITIINTIKVVATLFVIYIHGANIYGYAQQSVPVYIRPLCALAEAAVPAFMAVSGYLIFRKDIDWKNNINKKVKRLLIPFLIWSCFWVCMEAIGHKLLPDKFDDIFSWSVLDFTKGIIGIPFYISPLYRPLWYVRELFVMSLLAPLMQKPIKKFPLISGTIALVIWFLPLTTTFRESFTFFIIGGILSNNAEWMAKVKNIPISLAILISAIMGSAFSLIGHDITTRVAVVIMLILIYYVCAWLSKTNIGIRISETLIPYSFAIYLLHGKLLSIIQILYTSKLKSIWFVNCGYLIIPFVIYLLCLLISYIFKKILPGIYRISTGE